MKKYLQLFGKSAIITALALSTCIGVKAQDTKELLDMSLEEIMNLEVKVASNTKENIFTTPSTVSVIDRKFIKSHNIETVSEAISHLANMASVRGILKNNIPTSRWILQDYYANKVLVMIENVPLWNAITGQAELERVDIDAVERIEVLKGPASVLYGTNAYSGAINIILSNGSNKSSMHGGIGQDGYYAVGGNFNYKDGDLSVFTSINSRDSKGEEINFKGELGDQGKIRNAYNTKNLTCAVNYGNHNIMFNMFRNEETILGTRATFASGAGKLSPIEGIAMSYGLAQPLFKDIDMNLRLTYDKQNREILSDFSKLQNDSMKYDLKGYKILSSLGFAYKITDNLNLNLSGDFDYRKSEQYKYINIKTDSTVDDINLKNRDISEYSIAAQIKYSPMNFLTLHLGSRYTDNQLSGDNISSRATLVLAINENNSLKFIFGQSFRSPSLFEQYFTPNNKIVNGNINLLPEKSNSLEGLYMTNIDCFFIQLLGYYANYENKIFRGVNNGAITYINGKKFNAVGLEGEIKYMNPNVIDAFLSLGYVKGTYGDSVNGVYNFMYSPQFSASAGVFRSISNWDISAKINYWGEAKGQKEKIDAQFIVDASINYNHKISNKNITHSIIVKNLFDSNTDFAEYSRRNINDVPWNFGRRIYYNISINI